MRARGFKSTNLTAENTEEETQGRGFVLALFSLCFIMTDTILYSYIAYFANSLLCELCALRC